MALTMTRRQQRDRTPSPIRAVSQRAMAERHRLPLALLLAAITHAGLVFGIHFRVPQPAAGASQLEVTLVSTPGERPNAATHIAQAEQSGSGNAAEQERVARGQLAQPVVQQQPASAPERGQYTRASFEPRLQARRSEWTRNLEHSLREAPEGPESPSEHLRSLQQRLAALEASLHTPQDASSRLPRVRRITAVATRSSTDAAYLRSWRQRLEQVGNTWYPEASLRYGLYGTARLLVVLRSDGSLERAEILESSGYAVLDHAALRTVRMAAPFAPFPPELRATTDRLEIVRNWVFEPSG